jgi:hypothetical protein
MATVCEKDFALHVGSEVGLVDYWKFDDVGPPFQAEINNTLDELVTGTLFPPTSVPTGILNDCMRYVGGPAGSTSFITTVDKNPAMIPDNGFTFTTWVNFSNYGVLTTSTIFNINFYDVSDVPQFSIRFDLGQGPPPVFSTISTGIAWPLQSNFFNPTASFSTGLWYLIGIRYDPASKKIGVRRAHPVFGIGGWEESTPVVDDLSAIVKGFLLFSTVRDPLSATPQDYRQDESGFWSRLLTDSEFASLWGGGTPPSYPNIPQ